MLILYIFLGSSLLRYLLCPPAAVYAEFLCLSHSQAEFGSSQSDSRVWQVPLALESGEQVEQVAGAVRFAAAKHWKLMRNALRGNTAFVGA